MTETATMMESARAAMRKAVIRQAMMDYGLTEGEFFGQSRSPDCFKARSQAAHGLRQIGLSYPRIARILRRTHTTVLNYFPDLREKKGQRYGSRRILRHMAGDIRETIIACAKAEEVTIETLIVQWVGERASYELEAKARAA